MASERNTPSISANLLNIPQCVLRILLSYVDATTLYQLSQTCTYLKDLIEDPIFWKYIDARAEPNTNEKVEYCTERIYDKTTHLFFRCMKKNSGQIPSSFFKTISPFDNISVLALENQKIYGSKVSLKDFPTGLEELSLKKSYVKSSIYFFQHSAKKMKNLRVLILDECSWVNCSFLLSVSKYENLEIISAVKCMKAHLNMVPYLNVAKYGCKKLKILDCRFTGIGGELLRTFYSKQSLQNLYFQSFISAEADYAEKLKIGSQDHLSLSSVEAGPDLSITDRGLTEYSSTSALRPLDPIKKSVLYKDPYPDCSCNYEDSSMENIPSDTVDLMNDYVYIAPSHQTTKFVCQKHLQDVSDLPSNIKDFFFLNQRQFLSDVTSDVDSDSDTSGSEDERACCIYAMGTRMFVLPNVNNVNERSEIELPSNRVNNDLPFNIVIVNTVGSVGSAEESRPSTSTTESNREDQPSATNANKRKESESSRESDSDSSPDAKKSRLDPTVNCGVGVGPRKHHREHDKKRKHSGEFSSDRSKKLRNDGETDEKPDDVDKTSKDDGECNNGNEGPIPTDIDDLIDSTEDVCNRLNSAIEHGIETISRTFFRRSGESNSRRQSTHFNSDNSRCESRPSTSGTTNQKWKEQHPVEAGSSDDNGEEEEHKPSTSNRGGSKGNATGTENNQQSSVALKNGEEEERVPPPSHRLPGYRFLDNPNIHLDDRFLRIYGVGARCPKKEISLRRLSLRGYKRITDLTLRYIQNLDFDLLDLTYTSVTKEGIQNFLLFNPNCRIVHPLYCRCKPRNPF